MRLWIRPPVINTFTRSRGLLLLSCTALWLFGILIPRSLHRDSSARASSRQPALVTRHYWAIYLDSIYALWALEIVCFADKVLFLVLARIRILSSGAPKFSTGFCFKADKSC